MFAKFDRTGEILINRKKYSKYDPFRKTERVLYGNKKFNEKPDHNKEKYEELVGINELDTNITTAGNAPSTPFQLEIRIESSENKLKRINEEKKTNEILDINNPKTAQKLQNEEEHLKNDIHAYRSKYRQLGGAYKVADTIVQAKTVAFSGLREFKEKIVKLPVVRETLLKIPSFKAKQEVEMAKLLSVRLKKELSKPANPDSKTIEHLIVRAEKLTNIQKGT